MDRLPQANFVRLCGKPMAAPLWSHRCRGRDFFLFPLEVCRLSGNRDRLNILLSQDLTPALASLSGRRIRLCGQLRSYNNHRGDGARLVITVLAQEIAPAEEDDDNLVQLTGTLCKPPTLRLTPLGREICDLMLAVNRRYGRSDYLPCICWGTLAREAADWPVGTQVELTGRLQSRDYTKLTETGPVERTAFEVSASQLRRLE